MIENKILEGDVREVLKTLETESVDEVVTSPPYWGLRDYQTGKWEGGNPECPHRYEKSMPSENSTVGQRSNREYHHAYKEVCGLCGAVRVDSQIGLERTPEEYVKNLVEVFREVKRVLKKHGTCWLNLGDSYVSGKSRYSSKSQTISGFKDRGDEHDRKPDLYYHPYLKDKDLCGIPWRVAFALQEEGWYLRQDIIWSKPNPMPESVTDRCTKSHEYVFLLTKSGESQYWVHSGNFGLVTRQPAPDYFYLDLLSGERYENEPVEFTKEKITCPKCEGEGYLYGFKCDLCGGKGKVKRWQKTNYWQGHDYYYDNEAIKEPSIDPESYAGRRKRNAGTMNAVDPNNYKMHGSIGEDGTLKSGMIYEKRNKRSVWEVTTRPFKGAHFATFPENLIEPMILAGCPEFVCVKCGKPRERIIEIKQNKQKSDYSREGRGILGRETDQHGGLSGYKNTETKTVGYTDCGCNAGFTGGVVLDPFFGAGTTGVVALKQHKKFIGVELNPAYIKIAEKRLKPYLEQTHLHKFT